MINSSLRAWLRWITRSRKLHETLLLLGVVLLVVSVSVLVGARF